MIKIKNEIAEFCKLNEIKNVDEFITECLTIGFNIKKYSDKPKGVLPRAHSQEKSAKQEELTVTNTSETKKIINKSNEDDYEIYDSK